MPNSQKDNTTQETVRKIYLNCDQLKITSVVFSLSFFHDPKIIILSELFPVAGPLVYFGIIAQIGNAGGYFERKQLRAVARETSVSFEEVKKITDACCGEEVALLIDTPRGLSSKRIQKEIEKTARQRYATKYKNCEFIFPWTENDNVQTPRVDPPSTVGEPTSVTVTVTVDPKEGVQGGVLKKPERSKLVFLDDIELEAAILEYSRFEITPAKVWVAEGIKYLSAWYEKNPDKWRNGKFCYQDLIGWAKERCVETRTKGLKMKAAESLGKPRGAFA
jgi:hypothetical protein